MNNKNHNAIAARILNAREKAGFSQEELARRCGWHGAQTRISQYERGKRTPRDADLRTLARALSTTPEFLRYGIVSGGYALRERVPLVTSQQALRGERMDVAEWISVTADVSNSAFAIRVDGDSMSHPSEPKSIPHGSAVVVDPEAPYGSGDIVAAVIADQVVVKKLVIDGPNRYLNSHNPGYRPIIVDDDITIIGPVRELRIIF